MNSRPTPRARTVSGIFPVASPAGRPKDADLKLEPKPTGPAAPVINLADFRKTPPTKPAS